MKPIKNIEDWGGALSEGLHQEFSPSGHALVLQPTQSEPFMQVFEVRFVDGRNPMVLEYADGPITPVGWASDDEVVYHVWGEPLGKEPTPSLHAFSVANGTSRLICHKNDVVSFAWSGRPGHLSVLAEPQGKPGLFDLDTATGQMRRLSEFDAALERLDVCPLFGHSWCEARQEVALIGWPHGDYLDDGEQYTEENSHWTPMLDEPSIQDYVSERADGTRVTQRELTQEAKRKKPYRLFLLDASGECREVPGTYKAHRPLWSADGSMLSFEHYGVFGRMPPLPKRSISSIWLARREDLSLMRIGGCPLTPSTLMHPAGVLLCHLEDETIPISQDHGLARARARRWRAFEVRNGEVHPVLTAGGGNNGPAT
jgi:hypothetical protein